MRIQITRNKIWLYYMTIYIIQSPYLKGLYHNYILIEIVTGWLLSTIPLSFGILIFNVDIWHLIHTF